MRTTLALMNGVKSTVSTANKTLVCIRNAQRMVDVDDVLSHKLFDTITCVAHCEIRFCHL